MVFLKASHWAVRGVTRFLLFGDAFETRAEMRAWSTHLHLLTAADVGQPAPGKFQRWSMLLRLANAMRPHTVSEHHGRSSANLRAFFRAAHARVWKPSKLKYSSFLPAKILPPEVCPGLFGNDQSCSDRWKPYDYKHDIPRSRNSKLLEE